MVLFKRFPRFTPLPYTEQHLIPPQERSNYPSFAADFTTLEDMLMPTFRELDKEALRQQNIYRRQYIILIFGGSLVTIFGIVQIALQSIDWPGIAGAAIAFILFVTTTASRSFKNHERYLDLRLAAEELRGTYFLFLGHYHPYENDQNRIELLHRHVKDTKRRAKH